MEKQQTTESFSKRSEHKWKFTAAEIQLMRFYLKHPKMYIGEDKGWQRHKKESLTC